MNFRESPLWNYATQLYAQPEVEQTCLTLQDQQGADVDLLLLACWLGDQRLSLNPALLQALLEVSQPWQDKILGPMRKARQAIKQHIMLVPTDQLDQTRESMRNMELNAEHMEILALEDRVLQDHLEPDPDAGVEDITSANLWLYLESLDNTNDDLRQQLGQLLSAVFGTEEAAQLAFMTSS